MSCYNCPRMCGVDRQEKKGFCGMGEKAVVAKAYLHMWEEPCISGSRGSGTVFFSGCNLRCIFCQNHEISHGRIGREYSTEELAKVFLSLRDKGAHNINLVTPSHFTAQIRSALELAKSDSFTSHPLDIPIVYNTGGYDSVEELKKMEGMIDIYLPDLKYIKPDIAKRYSSAEDYFEAASAAVAEMYRQVGGPRFDADGIMKKGVIIRHLVLPGHIDNTIGVLNWISENMPKDIYVSLMSQFTPCYKACGHPVLDRHLTRHEYEKVEKLFVKLGINGYVQERTSATEEYIPDFRQDISDDSLE